MYISSSGVCIKSSHRLISHRMIPVTHLEQSPENLTCTGLYTSRVVLGSDTGLLCQGRSWQNFETLGNSADLTLNISSINPHILRWSSYTLFLCQGRETETMQLSCFVHKNDVKFTQAAPTLHRYSRQLQHFQSTLSKTSYLNA